MPIVKHSWLDIPRWCKVIHFQGGRSEEILKYVLLALGVKTWQKDIDVDKFTQEITLGGHYSVDKNKKVGLLDARNLKDHKDLLKAVNLVNRLGLKAFVHTDLSKENDKCVAKNHIVVTVTEVDENSSSVDVHYEHLKYGPIHKHYTLKHEGDKLELVHVKEE